MGTTIARPKPVDSESRFLAHELFFSTTDLFGNIISGNNIFVRVSQYNRNELIGSPHNIIRHPDMPRVVFKVLWDYLKAKKPVVAYVKNMSKKAVLLGFGSVFHVPGGYLSIRLKPTSGIFPLIPDIYSKLLKAEESGGMEASFPLLLEILKLKGFDDYDSFMSTVLIEELKSRQESIKTQISDMPPSLDAAVIQGYRGQSQDLAGSLRDIRSMCEEVFEAFDLLFQDFGNLLNVENTLKSTSTSVLNFSEQISILSLNVNINSYFAGVSGRTLSVVYKTINVKTEEIDSFTQAIVKCSKDISLHAQRLGFHTSAPRLQVAMVNAFVKEIYEESHKREITLEEISEMKNNIMTLIDLFMNTFSQLANLLLPIGGKINDILGLIESINSSIYELERCNFLGNIEAAVIGEIGTKFNVTFKEIKGSTRNNKAFFA